MAVETLFVPCKAILSKFFPVVAITTALGSLTGSIFEKIYSQNGAAAGAIAALTYLILRQWFRERQDLIKSYRADLQKAADERHEMVNQLNAQNFMIFMLMKTASPELLAEMSQVYKRMTGTNFKPAEA